MSCCDKEEFWIKNPTNLFCSLNPFVHTDKYSPKHLNSVSRLILYISLILYFINYKYWYIFLLLSLLFVILLYWFTNNKLEMEEYYGPLHEQREKKSNMNIDTNSGIQYYTPKSGRNMRADIPPVIPPRSLDSEYWGKTSNVNTMTNFITTNDLTQNHIPYSDMAGKSTSLGVPIVYQPMPPTNYPIYYPVMPQPLVHHIPHEHQGHHIPQTHQSEFSLVDENPLEVININLYQESEIKPTEKKPDEMTSHESKDAYNKIVENENKKEKFMYTTNTQDLFTKSPVHTYPNDYFNQPDKRLYLQDIQPNVYGYVMDQQPINSNVGISYSPQNPPMVADQVGQNGMNKPLYSRIDPQLVRTDGTISQQALNPTRTEWSAEYNNFTAPPGSINFEDIYDPRFTSYGDPYRGYSDVNLGQVQYYYSDVDAYRMPNFVTRSNVDFMEYKTPQGQIWPEYQRTAAIDDVRSHVESQYTMDEISHREDLMSLQMSKANRIAWAQRFAPLRQRGANTHSTTFGPGI